MIRLNFDRHGSILEVMVRRMRIGLAKSLVACLLAATSGAAQAQVTVFNSEDYGKTVLPIRQSIGSAVSYIKNRGNSFEPVGQLLPDNDVRRMSRAVGRLDILVEKDGQSSLVTCTGTVVRHDQTCRYPVGGCHRTAGHLRRQQPGIDGADGRHRQHRPARRPGPFHPP